MSKKSSNSSIKGTKYETTKSTPEAKIKSYKRSPKIATKCTFAIECSIAFESSGPRISVRFRARPPRLDIIRANSTRHVLGRTSFGGIRNWPTAQSRVGLLLRPIDRYCDTIVTCVTRVLLLLRYTLWLSLLERGSI